MNVKLREQDRYAQTDCSRRPLFRRRAVLALLFVWLAALACNLPVFAPSGGEPLPDPNRAARETLAATIFAPPPDLPAPDAPAPEVVPTTAMPEPLPVPPGIPVSTLEGNVFRYITQPGDTVEALALRFGVPVEQVLDPALYPPDALLPASLMLSIPNALGEVDYGEPLLPDAAIVNSPDALGFSVEEYVRNAGGFLSTYQELVDGETLSGAQVVQRIVDDMSINPRVLLAFLEYRSQWVHGSPDGAAGNRYPIGFYANQYSGLYKEMTLVARQLNIGYYGWRSGKVVTLAFNGAPPQRINPTVNAGTAALQYLFSTLYKPAEWQDELYGSRRFLSLYQQMFGDAWQRAAAYGPLLPDGLAQPPMELPFAAGERWSFTGGPHAAWGIGSPWGALDFAPSAVEKGCTVSSYWVTSAAPGLVVRTGTGQVLVDLDGDGYEQTGWVILYLHIAAHERVSPGTYVNLDDRIGHPSCEGGVSTGSHLHITRKYNGEWIGADGPVPFVLSGWRAEYGDKAYTGRLVRGDEVVGARPDGSRSTTIVR